MPDPTSIETLIIGAAGGLIGVTLKYIFDRLIETHKAANAAKAKPREQYHEKQVEAIIGVYERLKKCIDAGQEAFIHEADIAETGSSLSEAARARIEEELKAARAMEKELEDFYDSHCLYLPDELDNQITKLKVHWSRLRMKKWLAVRHETYGWVLTKEGVEEMRQNHVQAFGLLSDVEIAARKALRG
jgi:hypothetical protein